MNAQSPDTTRSPGTAQPAVTVLGLGTMGRALATAFVAGGRRTTVWNRTPGKAAELVAAGATEAADPATAIEASDLVVVCLFDKDSVREALAPHVASLAGRTVAMLTTFTPADAREIAGWVGEHQAGYLGAALMAIPTMIGQPEAQFFYSGPEHLFDAHRETLSLLGTSAHVGVEVGTSALYETSLLTGMYAMFFGFYHGAALIRTGGVAAKEFAALAGPWIRAMTGSLDHAADFIDKGDYTTDVQSLLFNRSALDHITHVSDDQGISPELPALLREFMDRQIRAGHGADSATRAYESIARPQQG
ncbi:NAD(P)-binding domain-containing protein [Streptomyces sp. HSW2009]|uniref:NAD(P)-dependent oxidoreductase n=1 Tax=Streptomyces sp. HSW2009 TaxID=3142890 RepID=UPI0032EF0623